MSKKRKLISVSKYAETTGKNEKEIWKLVTENKKIAMIDEVMHSGYTIGEWFVVLQNIEAQSTTDVVDKYKAPNIPEIESKRINNQNYQSNSKVDKNTGRLNDGAYKSNYGIAQFVVKILSVIGWGTILVGVIQVLIGLGSSSGYFMQLISPGFIAMVGGLFSVATAQIVKATVDNADHSYQIMMHLKSK